MGRPPSPNLADRRDSSFGFELADGLHSTIKSEFNQCSPYLGL